MTLINVLDSYERKCLALVSPGSSGGPLIAKNAEKVIAIHSAASLEGYSIGFSIPIYIVVELIDFWIANPMSEEEIWNNFIMRMVDSSLMICGIMGIAILMVANMQTTIGIMIIRNMMMIGFGMTVGTISDYNDDYDNWNFDDEHVE